MNGFGLKIFYICGNGVSFRIKSRKLSMCNTSRALTPPSLRSLLIVHAFPLQLSFHRAKVSGGHRRLLEGAGGRRRAPEGAGGHRKAPEAEGRRRAQESAGGLRRAPGAEGRAGVCRRAPEGARRAPEAAGGRRRPPEAAGGRQRPREAARGRQRLQKYPPSRKGRAVAT